MKIKTQPGEVNLAYISSPNVSSTNNYDVIQNKKLNNISNYPMITKEAINDKIIITTKDIPILDNFLYITNITKNGIPLYFKYKLRKSVKRYIDFEKQFFIFNKITNQIESNLVYKLIPIKNADDLYDIFIFFNTSITSYNHYYIFYKDSDGIETKETIMPEFAFYPTNKINYNFEYKIEKEYNESNIIIKIPNELKNDTKFYIDFINYHEINIEKINNISREKPWGIKIKNGFFEKESFTKKRLKFIYALKEFSEQLFDINGAPYKRIKETPEIFENKLIVSNKFIYSKRPINISINGQNAFTNKDFKSIDKINGVIELPRLISKNENVLIEYTAIIDYIEYTGFYDFNYGQKIKFNMNPCKNNKINFINTKGEKSTYPVFQIMKKPVYIYLRPMYTYHCNEVINNKELNYTEALERYDVGNGISYTNLILPKTAITSGFAELKKKLGGQNSTIKRAPNSYLKNDEVYWAFDNENKLTNNKIRLYNPNLLNGQPIMITYTISDKMKLSKTNKESSIFHSYKKISKEICELNGYILLGETYCFPNSTINDIEVIDARTRGGGITNKIDDDIRRIIEPESDSYWDIGFWDGENFQQKALCFRFNKCILKENGGKVTINEIKESIEKHIEAGTEYIIEFYDIDDHILI
jgi:hypothetical protein